MNLYIPQLQFMLQYRCNPSKRENRQNGNEKGSQESTCKEGRKKGNEEEVATITTTGNIEGGASSVPLNVCGRNMRISAIDGHFKHSDQIEFS
jgi:hypothetical protein